MDESERIARWLAEHPADAHLLASLDNAMANLALRDTAGIDVEGALQRVLSKRDTVVAPPAFASPKVIPFKRRTASSWRLVTGLAAAAVIIVAARALLQRKVGADSRESTVATARTYASAIGKRE